MVDNADITLKPFGRDFASEEGHASYIGSGSIGGKGSGLVQIRDLLQERKAAGQMPDFDVRVPGFTVLRTGVFDDFISQNHLSGLAESPPPDDVIAQAFQQAGLPAGIPGDLRSIVEDIRTPLAVRSSSLLEDSIRTPFAGVYETKMIPNNQKSVDERFRSLAEAAKFVYSSAYFAGARDFRAAAGLSHADEKMAVLIQQVVGERFHDRFYPVVSGVARSFNFYSFGRMKPGDGIVSLALGLGKTIVDGGQCWTYSPAHPALAPPHNSLDELIDNTQRVFWAVNMGKPPAYDPIHETEYLVRENLTAAEQDGVLNLIASTYDAQSGRLSPGIGKQGERVLNFSLLLGGGSRLNAVIRHLLSASEDLLGFPVEIEFAATFNPPQLNLLQVRPMMVSSDAVTIGMDEWNGREILLRTESALGNGTDDSVQDVVYIRRGKFDRRQTPRMARELERINRAMVNEKRPYLLAGFGRWGSSDPWLGIPVQWPQVSGARAIVEASPEGVMIDASQGSHFFHNLMSFQAFYFSLRAGEPGDMNWNLLDDRPSVREEEFARQVRLPLRIKVDGRTGRGIVMVREGVE